MKQSGYMKKLLSVLLVIAIVSAMQPQAVLTPRIASASAEVGGEADADKTETVDEMAVEAQTAVQEADEPQTTDEETDKTQAAGEPATEAVTEPQTSAQEATEAEAAGAPEPEPEPSAHA
ncbi:MAG: hypothetical protein LUI07_03970 [Lachnospiraceae bacterium]|nr:hypothetical protein [Lachnospiraceae bacterium]